MIGSQTSRAVLVALAFPSLAMAQFGNEWVEFTQDNSRVNAPNSLVLNDQEEKDYAWGDLDQDGWTDLVIVRKQPFTSAGKGANVLLMNEGGVLTNRTSQFASASDVPGDNGFLTPTNDRDVVIEDLNGDGWLDLVTATTLSAGDPKHISHPRVYMNLGNDGGGNWLGLRHEDARFPQLLLGNGQASWPRFCAVDAGDVTGDGFADLYFADYDSGGSGGGDMNDRLLVNDGNGFFTDESNRMTSLMLNSDFGASAYIDDINGDGANDVIKDSGLTAFIRINYNDDANIGDFNLTDSPPAGAPYFTQVGDLNNDDRLDLVISDDGADTFKLNEGNDILGRVDFGPGQTFDYASGGDDGFAGNSLVVDLDMDGWNDVIITDVDVDIAGCSRRTHIYHNSGGVPGGDVDLFEEAQQAGSSGWKGVVGMNVSDLRGTHDVAVFDIDNDGDLDMVFGLCTGTDIWMNNLDPSNDVGVPYCTAAINSTGTGAEIAASGSASASAENLTLSASDLPANQPGVFFFGLNQVQNPFGNGFLCASGNTTRITPPAFANGSGEASRAVEFAIYGGSLTAGSSWNFQFWYRDPAAGGAGFNLTNGVGITFLP